MTIDPFNFRYQHRNALNGETNRIDQQQAEIIRRHEIINAYYSAYQSQQYAEAKQPEVIDGGELVADPEPTEPKALPKPD